jgi:hypothetical protein
MRRAKPSKEKPAARRSVAPEDARVEDARVAHLLDALRDDAALKDAVAAFERQPTKGGRRRFGSNGLKVGGKLFALFTQGTLVVKLPRERVEALVDEGVGEAFDPGHGRRMREWLTVVSPRAQWVELAKEAGAYVARSTRAPRRRSSVTA